MHGKAILYVTTFIAIHRGKFVYTDPKAANGKHILNYVFSQYFAPGKVMCYAHLVSPLAT